MSREGSEREYHDEPKAPQVEYSEGKRIDDLIGELVALRDKHGNMFIEMDNDLMMATGSPEFSIPIPRWDGQDQQFYMDAGEPKHEGLEYEPPRRS